MPCKGFAGCRREDILAVCRAAPGQHSSQSPPAEEDEKAPARHCRRLRTRPARHCRGATVPDEVHPAHRHLPPGRRRGPHGAPGRPEDGRGARPAGGGGEQGRRERPDRRGGSRARGPGRLHADARCLVLRGEPGPVREAALRLGEGVHAARGPGALPERARRHAVLRAEERAGTGGAGEGEARHGGLRVLGQRFGAAPGGRALPGSAPAWT